MTLHQLMNHFHLHIIQNLIRKSLILLLLFLCTQVWSQNYISVEKFRLLEKDLTANTYGTMERDQNGEIAAIIKVVTPETGFSFDAGMLGIVKTVQKTGEIWVYVPHGLQRLTISHQNLGFLRDYIIPIPIEAARTYEMILATGSVRTYVEDVLTAQWVTFRVTPQNAIVTIDANPYALMSDGTISQLLPYGTHSYRIDAPGYISENGVVEVTRGDGVTIEVSLKSSKGTVTLECPMKEAEIYLNGNLVGTGSWTGQLDAAMYQVEIKRDGHRSRTTSFILQPQEEKTISLPSPQPIYGAISVTSQPIGATVYIDGVEVGVTPFLKAEVLTGTRKMEFRKQDYRTVTMDVEILESQLNSFNTELSDAFTATVSTEPTGATLQIDGKYMGQTPYSFETSSGDYSISLNKLGYNPYKKKVHLDASNPELNITLQRKVMSKTNVYVGATYQATHQTSLEAFAGAYLAGFNLEAGYHLPKNAEQKIWWMNTTSWSGYADDVYSYNLDYILSVHLGYGILLMSNHMRITPRVGVLFNQIKGQPVNESNNGIDEQTYVVAGRAGLRVEFSPIQHIAIVCTPAYDMPIKMGSLASNIDNSTTIVKQWCGGFSINAGLELYF